MVKPYTQDQRLKEGLYNAAQLFDTLTIEGLFAYDEKHERKGLSPVSKLMILIPHRCFFISPILVLFLLSQLSNLILLLDNDEDTLNSKSHYN